MEWPFADPRDGSRNIIATIQVPIRRPNHTARRRLSPEAHRRGGACRAGTHAATLSLHSTALRRDHAARRIGQRQFGGLAVHAAMRWLEGAGTQQDGTRAARKGRDVPSGPGPGAPCRRRLRTLAPPSAVRTRKSRADAPQGRRGLRIGESARRPQGHGAERRGLPPRLRAAARGGSGARISRHGSPPPRPAGADLRSRPPKRAEHDSRPPSPAAPIRFTAD